MSENEPGDREPRGGKEPQIGLSFSREDTAEGERPTADRPRRKPGAYENLQRVTRVDQSVVARWFLPIAVLFLILLVTGTALFLTQGSQLDALEQQVAALEEQASRANPAPDLNRIRDRLDALENRSGNTEGVDAKIQALQDVVAEQSGKIEALTARLDKPAQSSGTSGGGTSEPDASGSASSQTEGGWLINLITVADRASAETFQERLSKLGVSSRIQSVTVEDKSLLRVVAPGFSSRNAAENAGAELKKQLELSDDPWITRE